MSGKFVLKESATCIHLEWSFAYGEAEGQCIFHMDIEAAYLKVLTSGVSCHCHDTATLFLICVSGERDDCLAFRKFQSL